MRVGAQRTEDGTTVTEALAMQSQTDLQREIERLEGENRRIVRESENLKRRIVRLERDKQYSAITAENIERVRDFNAQEKELQHLYNQLLLSNCPDMIFVFDRSYMFLLGTETSSKFLGYSSHNDLADKPLEFIFGRRFGKEELVLLQETGRAVMENSRPAEYDQKLDVDGETVFLTITISPANNLEGECMGVVIVLHDVTALTLLKDAAEKSSVSKSVFLATMSHEMRTPMNAIIGMSSIAKNTNDIEKMRYCMDKIDNASVHLLGVINDILDISKIESGKFELSLNDFDLERMLIRVVNVQNFRIEEKRQTLRVNLDPGLPHFIHSDEQRLSQVITNLLSNAVKFTPDEGVITLEARLAERQGDRFCLEVAVSDTGIGISAEQQSRLFRSFEQADSGISRRFGGTGLGLVICKNIVEIMGGSIWVESALNEGSRFTFRVWVDDCGPDFRADSAAGEVAWDKIRILAVDDQPEVLDYFSSIGASLGFHCDIADGGDAALRRVQSARLPYHVIFVDWMMPDMDGIELTRRIKQLCGEGSIVIMISAAGWDQMEQEATAAGVDRYMPKPLFTSAVADCITECLNLIRPQPPEDQAEPVSFRGRHILLAEDVEVNREIVLALLEHTGVRISCAENGAEAVEMFSAAPDAYDLIFMDIHMPVVDGYAATEQIRALGTPRAKTVPIIAMTANVFREDIEKCLESGMDDHIGKPIDIDEVIGKMTQYLA